MKYQYLLVDNDNTLMDFDIDEALAMKKPFKDQLFKMAAEISI